MIYLKEQIKQINIRLKQAESRSEYAEMNISKLHLRIDDLGQSTFTDLYKSWLSTFQRMKLFARRWRSMLCVANWMRHSKRCFTNIDSIPSAILKLHDVTLSRVHTFPHYFLSTFSRDRHGYLIVNVINILSLEYTLNREKWTILDMKNWCGILSNLV